MVAMRLGVDEVSDSQKAFLFEQFCLAGIKYTLSRSGHTKVQETTFSIAVSGHIHCRPMCCHQILCVDVSLLVQISFAGHFGRLVAGVHHVPELLGTVREAILQGVKLSCADFLHRFFAVLSLTNVGTRHALG